MDAVGISFLVILVVLATVAALAGTLWDATRRAGHRSYLLGSNSRKSRDAATVRYFIDVQDSSNM